MRTRTKRCTLMNQRTQAPLCSDVTVARTFLTRLIGLLAYRELRPNRGLWLQPSNGIHTMGMRFSIDVVAFDRDGRVLKTAEGVQPWRIVGMPRKTRSVLELPAGHLRAHPVQVGDVALATERLDGCGEQTGKAPQESQQLAGNPVAHLVS